MNKLKTYLPAIICLLLCGIFLLLGFRFVITDGSSMLPTYSPGDTLLVGLPMKNPEPGDAVLIEHNGKFLIKRILAVEGDTAIIPTEIANAVSGNSNSSVVYKVGTDEAAGTMTTCYEVTEQEDMALQAADVLGLDPAALFPGYWTTYHYWSDPEAPVIPDGYMFVIGDNPSHSTDSRSQEFGLVPESAIRGYVLYVFRDN